MVKRSTKTLLGRTLYLWCPFRTIPLFNQANYPEEAVNGLILIKKKKMYDDC